jgi:hypothetical protein
MFIGVLLSVEFCFALKIYLKRAPFYNASAWGKFESTDCGPSSKVLEARF